MSLFKRKQSKEKDLREDYHSHGSSTGHVPPIGPLRGPAPGGGGGAGAGPPGQYHGPNGPGHFNGPNGSTPPMVNGRRMTSNPVHPTQAPPPPMMQSNQSVTSLQGYDVGPNGNGSQFPMPHPSQNQNQQPPHPSALQPAHPRPPSAPPASYPWSTRPLRLYAPQTSPPALPQSPFPRYGLSVPAFPSHSGHMLIFGGLVHESVKNDLWSMDVRDCTTMAVKTKGDAPMPRVGHASVIADRIMLVWGGDTKVHPDDHQDEGLYVLDLRTQEWTRLPISPGPVGRYGHAVCLHESKFYIFGGQAEGAFMNDLWAYDIRSLSGNVHRWEQIQYNNTAPPKRTGHALVSHQGKLYLFGGTDGSYHYNDTWSFDIATGEWTELSCIGYIPHPREGHAAAIVDDVLYVFGGRDVNGKDLGDLAAFRITNQRWYMFQNMGPAPTPRSGHAMVAAHGKIFVVGGEANALSGPSRDDPSLVHILDTLKIKYPSDNQPPRQLKPRPSDAPSEKYIVEKGPMSEKGPLNERVANLPTGNSPPINAPPADTPTVQRGMPSSGSMDSISQGLSPSNSSDRLASMAQPPQQPASNNQPGSSAAPPRQETAELGPPIRPNANGPPQRPRREGDEEYRRAMSPPNGPSSPSNATQVRVTSPTSPSSPPQHVKNGFNASVLGTRSPSPRLRMADGERPAPPPDAFYYGRSPTTSAFSGRPPSVSGNSGDVIRELKAKETEIEAGRKREAALRLILSRAVQQGFAVGDDEAEVPDGELGESDVVRKLADALVRLKQEKAAIQNDLASQVQNASDKAVESERLRRGALQEAAFYRAKIATLESNAPIDLARIEKERINELERQLANLAAEHANASRQMQRTNSSSASDKALQACAAEREAEAVRRAEEAEEAQRTAVEELSELQAKFTAAETSLREHTERLITLTSTVSQREAERDQFKTQYDDAVADRDQHLTLIEQAQSAISSSGTRTAEVEALHEKATSRVHELESELAEAKAELESKSRDVQTANERLAAVENSYAKSREEADNLRSVTTGRLGELLDSHRSLRADEGRANRAHQEQLRALEEEGSSLRRMLREAGQRVDAAEAGVSHHRGKAREVEASLQSLRAEMRAHKLKLSAAQSELAKFKEMQASRDSELRDREMAATELETRCTVLRNLLADHGIAVTDGDMSNGDTSNTNTRELEAKLRDSTRAHENAQREIDDLTRRCHEAEDKVESLGRLVDRIKDARSPTSISMGARSPTPPGPGDERQRADFEQRLAEIEMKHQEKVKQVESDYQTAVRYVKGSEKMLKRMKDELNKQKVANQTLQSELDSLHGRSSEPGSRTREASGRATPTAIDGELSRRLQSLQQQYNTLQAELTASKDVMAAREREVELLRRRVDDAEKECDTLREELIQSQTRINTLLEMNQPRFGVGSEDGDADELDLDGLGRGGSEESSEEASMAFDKFSKELKQWDRTRGDLDMRGHESDDDTIQYGNLATKANHDVSGHQHHQGHGHDGDSARSQSQNQGRTVSQSSQQQQQHHRRHSSEYSGDWAQ